MSNGPGSDLAALPLWARVISVLGFPTVVAVVLLAVILGWLQSPLTQILVLQQQQIGLMQRNLEAATLFRAEERAMLEYQNILLRTLCKSFAKETQQCEPRYRGYEEKEREKETFK